jgi:uncharacterized protein with NRDE domain
MGVNSHGLFAGLTNRPTEARRPERRSRGLLVVDALRHKRAGEAAREMQSLSHGSYNPFNLYLADGRESFVTCQREDALETVALQPGVHVLCNRDLDDLKVPKIARIRAAVDRLDLDGPLEALRDGLAELLRLHEPADNPLESVCIHTEGYGTRSSAILALGPDRWRYWHADGPPCATKYRNLAKLLDELQ